MDWFNDKKLFNEQFQTAERMINPERRAGRSVLRKTVSFIVTALCVIALAVGYIVCLSWNRSTDSIQALSSYKPSQSLSDASPESIPSYQGEDVTVLNGNQPCFTAYDIEHLTGEIFSELDEYGRCGTAVAMLHRSMMPEGERGSIGAIKPSGWHTVKYPELIPDNYLYNRCHLIAYAMTGQNANPLNLITGTRYLNRTLMLPYEKQVLQYLDESDHHVLYRVTPYFQDMELVARGVEMEAYSVEDHGRGVSFHVYAYNVQPGIEIDYATGESWIAETDSCAGEGETVMKNGSIMLLYGNWLMVICACFYLAWWMITFKPPAPEGTPVGSVCLTLAFLSGLGGLVWCIRVLNMPVETVHPGFSSLWIAAGGVVAYIILLAGTGVLLHRQVTSELLIITGWAVLELCLVNYWHQMGNLSDVRGMQISVIILAAAIVSLICYLLYYKLPYEKGYIDGCIPLGLVAVVMAGINVAVRAGI